MSAAEITAVVEEAIATAGVEHVTIVNRPRLLSDNGPAFISRELGNYLGARGIKHIRGKPFHPMTQGKIERYHRSMKSIVTLDNYYSPEELEAEISSFVDYYKNERYHESLDNVTPADVYFGRAVEILAQRKQIKKRTMKQRRIYYRLIKIHFHSTTYSQYFIKR
jgi:putative transposase